MSEITSAIDLQVAYQSGESCRLEGNRLGTPLSAAKKVLG
jgi:hypothetical protein